MNAKNVSLFFVIASSICIGVTLVLLFQSRTDFQFICYIVAFLINVISVTLSTITVMRRK